MSIAIGLSVVLIFIASLIALIAIVYATPLDDAFDDDDYNP